MPFDLVLIGYDANVSLDAALRGVGVVVIEKLMIDSFKTKNGIEVWIRPLLPQDAPYLVDLFEHTSANSRYRRFRQPVNHLSPERVMAKVASITHTSPQVSFIAVANLPDQMHRWVWFGVFVWKRMWQKRPCPSMSDLT